MITCLITYQVDPWKLEEFENFSQRWLALVPQFGGTHHGYFLPAEGANDVAYALFSFHDLAAYERYRADAATNPECIAAFAYAKETGCFSRAVRTFLKPLLPAERSVAENPGKDTPDRGWDASPPAASAGHHQHESPS